VENLHTGSPGVRLEGPPRGGAAKVFKGGLSQQGKESGQRLKSSLPLRANFSLLGFTLQAIQAGCGPASIVVLALQIGTLFASAHHLAR